MGKSSDDDSNNEVVIRFPYFRIYKDGSIDRLLGEEIIPPSPGAETGVRSHDVTISARTGLSARLFLPQTPDPSRKKLPLVVLVHGGAFCIETPFSPRYHLHGATLAAEAHVAVLSVHYRRAPEHLLPTAYDDVWEALEWVGAHSVGTGPEARINTHADLGRVFVVGVSAGATLAHYAVRRAGVEGGPAGVRILGLATVHPFFGNDQPDKLIDYVFPGHAGLCDPRLNPSRDPELRRLRCEKVLVFVAEKDFLRDRGLAYYEALKKSGWRGEVELEETLKEDHTFHLFNPDCDHALELLSKLVSFLKKK